MKKPSSRRRVSRGPSPLRSLLVLAVALLGASAAVVLPAGEAQACGGFFCSISSPVEQTGEEILFAVDGTQVTAHIRIQYAGPAESFSWVLPVPGMPTIGVGSDEVFTSLHSVTDPRFEIDWVDTQDCYYQGDCFLEADAGGVPTSSPNDDGGVTVLDEGSVGPFDYQIIEGDTGAALYDWLNDNGYDQPPTAQPLVEYYTAQDYVFVAVKLQKDADAGEIQPLVLDFDSPTLACIPLRLTSIAANPNMPVTTWILGEARAVPMNYFHVTLNPNAFDWLNCGSPSDWNWERPLTGACRDSYNALVDQATNTVFGHGFVTEFAGDSAIMDARLYSPGRYDTARLATMSPEQFIQDMLNQGFPRTPLVQQIIRSFIPMPDPATLPADCQDETSFYATWNIGNCIQHMPADWTWEPALMAQDLDNRIVQPLVDAQALFDDHGYLSRMFTLQSPDEMNRDPMFSFNPQLPDVSNVHTVTARAYCSNNDPYDVQFVRLTFPDGTSRTVTGQFQQCGGFVADAGMGEGQPALATIQVMDESGAPLVISPDEVAEWDLAIAGRVANPNQSNIPQTESPIDDGQTGTFGQVPQGTESDSDCDCQVRASGPGDTSPWAPAGIAALLLGLVGLRRRRRD